jgi:hypothetical protein
MGAIIAMGKQKEINHSGARRALRKRGRRAPRGYHLSGALAERNVPLSAVPRGSSK